MEDRTTLTEKRTMKKEEAEAKQLSRNHSSVSILIAFLLVYQTFPTYQPKGIGFWENPLIRK